MRSLKWLAPVFLIGFLGGIGLAFSNRIVRPNKNSIVPQPPTSQLNFNIAVPPKNSLVGQLEAMSGEVYWQSRVATEPAQLSNTRPIQQGENLMTGENGQGAVTFSQRGSLQLSRSSAIELIQTLPGKFVFNQLAGTVDYYNNETGVWSVRVLHLLIIINQGEVRVAIDKDTGMVTATVVKGTARIGYNDREYNSQVMNLKADERFVFNDHSRDGVVE